MLNALIPQEAPAYQDNVLLAAQEEICSVLSRQLLDPTCSESQGRDFDILSNRFMSPVRSIEVRPLSVRLQALATNAMRELVMTGVMERHVLPHCLHIVGLDPDFDIGLPQGGSAVEQLPLFAA